MFLRGSPDHLTRAKTQICQSNTTLQNMQEFFPQTLLLTLIQAQQNELLSKVKAQRYSSEKKLLFYRKIVVLEYNQENFYYIRPKNLTL